MHEAWVSPSSIHFKRFVGSKCQNLISTLDFSFNLLRHVPEALSRFPELHTVYFVQNKITKISGLDTLGATLRSLELGGNRIRVCIYILSYGLSYWNNFTVQNIEGLDALVNLEELWLGKNKITKLEVRYSRPSTLSNPLWLFLRTLEVWRNLRFCRYNPIGLPRSRISRDLRTLKSCILAITVSKNWKVWRATCVLFFKLMSLV